MASGTIVAVCTSKKKGTSKSNVEFAVVEQGFGLRDDAHGGDWHRQISLLSLEQIDKMKEKGLDLKPGSFAENLTTQGFDLGAVKLGDQLRIGGTVILEVTQIGKECHTRCAIYNKLGECIMPEQGVFTKVVEGGEVKVGDSIEMIQPKA